MPKIRITFYSMNALLLVTWLIIFVFIDVEQHNTKGECKLTVHPLTSSKIKILRVL